MDICRYESFEKFCEMLFFKQITLSAPESWFDGYENYLLQLSKNKEDETRMRDIIKRNKKVSDDDANEIIKFIKSICSNTRCKCFSKSFDAEQMWHAYKFNNQTILWKTTTEKIEKINYEFDTQEVKYDLEEKGLNSLLNLTGFINNQPCIRNDFEFFSHKLKRYSYEDELRVIHTKAYKEGEKVIYKFPIKCSLNEFIDGVMVHPLAKEEFVKTVEQICKEFDIKFLGKSKVYERDKIF